MRRGGSEGGGRNRCSGKQRRSGSRGRGGDGSTREGPPDVRNEFLRGGADDAGGAAFDEGSAERHRRKRHVDDGARDIGVSRLLFRDEIRAGGSERVAGHRDEAAGRKSGNYRSEEHTSELQSL